MMAILAFSYHYKRLHENPGFFFLQKKEEEEDSKPQFNLVKIYVIYMYIYYIYLC